MSMIDSGIPLLDPSATEPAVGSRVLGIRDRILSLVKRGSVSDIFLTPGQPIALVFRGELEVLADEIWTQDEMAALAAALDIDLKDPAHTTWERAWQVEHIRFRISVARFDGGVRVMLRLLPFRIPTVEEVSVPQVVLDRFVALEQGLVLICGPTGSGKSTSIAAMLNWRSARRPQHVLTLEDPIEYVFPSEAAAGKPLFTQRQVHRDVPSFSAGLRAALRQAPKVIMVGEIRDADTAEIALQAAETGHVVVATLHTPSVDQTIQRFIQLIEVERTRAAQATLGDVLEITMCQRLVRGKEQKVVCLHEIMLRNTSITNRIRTGDFPGIKQDVELSSASGMRLFKRAIQEAIAKGLLPHDFTLGT